MRVLLTLVFGIAACAGPLACKPQAPAATLVSPRTTMPEAEHAPMPMVAKKPAKTLLMHYMPWYQTPAVRGKWGTHWTGHESQHHPELVGHDGLPDIWSHFHPLIGLYDSTDPDLLECHLLQMKLAGVDGVIVDWYGISNAADYPPIHDATRAMFAAAPRFGMKFAICFEDRTIKYLVDTKQLKPDEVAAHLTQTLVWMQANWFSQPQYFRLNDRPLLLNFGPIFVKEPEPWETAFQSLPVRPAFFALHHLWKKVGADGGFTWIHKEAFDSLPDMSKVRRRIQETFEDPSKNSNQVIPSAYPGYQDVYRTAYLSLDYRGGETLRQTLAVGMEGPWKILQLVTWNDYGEGTMIEPTHEFGYGFLEIVQEARKKETGDFFTFTADDLRLPARLYGLRKSGNVPVAQLDAISRWLSDGECRKAQAALSRITG